MYSLCSINWGEPERAPHKRYSHARIFLLYTVWPEIFEGANFRQFSRLTGDPRKLNPQNKMPKHTRTRAITGGVSIVMHAAARLD